MNTRAGLAFICLASASSVACDVSAQVGSAFLTSGSISPATGGTISVDVPTSFGPSLASIQIPAGALAQEMEIDVSLPDSLASGDWVAIGPAVEWSPDDLALLSPADYLIPAVMPSGREPDDVVLLVDGPDGVKATSGPQLQCDGASLHFSAAWLGTFQAAIGKACSNRAGCSAGNACVHGGCRPDPDGM